MEISNEKVLDLTARQCNDLHKRIVSGEAATLADKIRLGEILAAQKVAVGHGNFVSWIEKNCEFSYDTARVYMRMSEQPQNTDASVFSGSRETKRKAKATRANKANSIKNAVLKELRNGPGTASEVSARIGDASKDFWKRFGDLENEGLIVATGESRRSRKGRAQKVWKVREASEPAPEPKLVKPATEEPRDDVPDKARDKFNRALEKAKAREFKVLRVELEKEYAKKYADLQTSYEATVQAEVLKRLPDHAKRKIAALEEGEQAARELQRIWSYRSKVIVEAAKDFIRHSRSIIGCLHPDRAPADRREQFTDATDIIIRLKAAFEKTEVAKW